MYMFFFSNRINTLVIFILFLLLAILTVDISDVKPLTEGKESPGNNNNGILKAKRYSSDDLYKPRYNSRTRTRASEQVGI